MTTATFKHIDPTSYVESTEAFVKPWSKVDGPGWSFKLIDKKKSVENLRGQEQNFGVDISGFAVYKSPAKEKKFVDETAIMNGYYKEVEQLLKNKLPGVKKVKFNAHVYRSTYTD